MYRVRDIFLVYTIAQDIYKNELLAQAYTKSLLLLPSSVSKIKLFYFCHPELNFLNFD